MNDILTPLQTWIAAGEPVALATVVATWGSSPRQAGAKMAVTASGKIAGSVSGGCVEGAVVETALAVLETGLPQLLHFGVADETAWEVGLACGGEIDVFVQRLAQHAYEDWRRALHSGSSGLHLTVLSGKDEFLGRSVYLPEGQPPPSSFPPGLLGVFLAAAEVARQRGTGRIDLGQGVEVFAEAVTPPRRLVIVGGVHISIALARIAGLLGYRTVIVDPRRMFGTAERFAHADELVQDWPDAALEALGLGPGDAVAVLTHDPKLDDPALLVALRSRAYYVGALGSRTTQAKRRARLLAAGLVEAQLDRLSGPIGLDIGARTPEEIALAVMAEVVAAGAGK